MRAPPSPNHEPDRIATLRARPRVWLGVLAKLLVAVICLTFRVGAVAAEPAPSEDQIKAAFLLNFPKYIEWPLAAFADADSPIVLTVIADKGVEKELRKMGAGKLFNGRLLEVRNASVSDAAGVDSHILFIGLSEERQASRIIAGLGASSVLTVGECDDFFADGGIIKLTRRERKVQLEINLATAHAAGLKISSKLLSVAQVVKREGKQP